MKPSLATPSTTVTAPSRRSPRISYSVGWWILVLLTSLLAVNHAIGALTFATSDDERALFVIFLAFEVFTLVVLTVPYRRRDRWSWWAMWIPVAATALPLVLFASGGVGTLYAGLAGVMAAAQILTLRAFPVSRLG